MKTPKTLTARIANAIAKENPRTIAKNNEQLRIILEAILDAASHGLYKIDWIGKIENETFDSLMQRGFMVRTNRSTSTHTIEWN